MSTLSNIKKIHATAPATFNRKYVADTGEAFIGLKNGRLKELIEFPLISKTKQVEIDFGSTLYQTQKIFTIFDKDISSKELIIASLAYEAPSGKSLDELEMDELTLKCKANDGYAEIVATSLYGSVYGKFKINYTINY